VAVHMEQLKYPAGRIRQSLFPDLTEAQLEEVIQTWLDEAVAKPAVVALGAGDVQDRAVVAWVYWRAFDAVCIDLATNPARAAQTDAGTSQYDKDQRDLVASMAANALAEYEGLVVAQDEVSSAQYASGARTVSHDFQF
jgi:hypothetical protein